jgi:hypothetical protein
MLQRLKRSQHQERSQKNSAQKSSYQNSLVMLGIAATMAYSVPLLTSMDQAHASGGREGRKISSVSDPMTAKECSDCHQIYGAGLLPQGSWRHIMGNLQNHFGEDASLPEKTRSQIESFLVNNSPPGDGPLRITETIWFKRQHGKVKDMSKCNDCHGRGGRWLWR